MHPEGSFKIGHPSFWNCHKKNYNPTHEDSQYDKLDPQKAKKNSISVNVKKKGTK
jgi:hypothetical protein